MANSRIYVQDTIKDVFLEHFKKLAVNRRLGDPTQPDINHGSQADKLQYETVMRYVDIGRKDGVVFSDGNIGSHKHDNTSHGPLMV